MQTLPSLSFGEAIKLCCQNYAKCSGRARRSEFWYFYLFCFIIYFVVGVIIGPISSNWYYYDYYYGYRYSDGFYVVMTIILFCSIFLAIPSISVSVRRLHDTGRPGVYYFVCLIPFAGPFILLYFCSIDSEERVNEYGPSPKYILPLNQPINPPVTVVPVPVPVPAYPQPPMAQPVPTYNQPPMAQGVPTYNQPPTQPYMPAQPVTYPGPPPYPQ